MPTIHDSYNKRRVLKNTDGTLYYWNYPKELWVDKQRFIMLIEKLMAKQGKSAMQDYFQQNSTQILFFVAKLPGDMVNLLDEATQTFISNLGVTIPQVLEMMEIPVPDDMKPKPEPEIDPNTGMPYDYIPVPLDPETMLM